MNYSEDYRQASEKMKHLSQAGCHRSVMRAIGGELNQTDFFWWMEDRFPGELDALQSLAFPGAEAWRTYCAALEAYGRMWADETGRDQSALMLSGIAATRGETV